jgi:prophage tail gpP-like protein
MGIQTIIDGAVTIDIQRNKVATSTVSRSGRYKTGQLVSNQPFQLILCIDHKMIMQTAEVCSKK